MILFGFLKGIVADEDIIIEPFEKYQNYHNSLQKEDILSHMESLEKCLTGGKSTDQFTGEKIDHGMLYDGDFGFPLEFIHYFKNYDIGIPPEYEAYLKTIL